MAKSTASTENDDFQQISMDQVHEAIIDKAQKHNQPSQGVLIGYLSQIGTKLQNVKDLNDLHLLTGLDKLENFTS